MSNIIYRIKHVGIRTDSDKEARRTAAILGAMFGFNNLPETDAAVWAGTIFEVMKSDARGARGHVALQTDDVEAAIADLAAKGIHFDESSIRRDEAGRINFIYLDLELNGFMFHLTT